MTIEDKIYCPKAEIEITDDLCIYHQVFLDIGICNDSCKEYKDIIDDIYLTQVKDAYLKYEPMFNPKLRNKYRLQ